ncbi:MAG: hypothetical protein K0R50_1142 [Eubacterium sp.]|jgi:hypothetical protein|nr:hypothetical protein [Eubacterium sp.]
MDYNSQDIINKIRNGEYKLIGSGSCRVVFDLNNGYVVKIAKDVRGIEQNNSEYSIYNSHKSHFFAEVPSISEDGRMLIMSKAKRIKNIRTVYSYYKVRGIDSLVKLDNLSEDLLNNDLGRGDIRRPSSWGFIDGVPVIIDYGLTHKIFKKYYRGNLLIKKRFPPIKYW